jgi:hypothetical protein
MKTPQRLFAVPLVLFTLCVFNCFAQETRSPKDTSSDNEIYTQAVGPFTHLLKSEGKARHHLGQLQIIADHSPYAYLTFVRLSQRLLVASVDENTDLRILYSSSFAASAISDDDEGFARISLTLGDLYLGNTQPSITTSILIQIGFPVYKLAAGELKLKESRIRELINKDVITHKDLTTVLIAAFEHNYNFNYK